MKLYGLKSKKKNCLLGFQSTSNSGGDFCVGVQFELTPFYGDGLWVVTKKETAENVATSSPPGWFNASHDTPEWDKNYLGELEVVCLNDYEET